MWDSWKASLQPFLMKYVHWEAHVSNSPFLYMYEIFNAHANLYWTFAYSIVKANAHGSKNCHAEPKIKAACVQNYAVNTQF